MKEDIESKLSTLAHENKEIIFIPIINSFNFAHAEIIELFNTRTNMIVLENCTLKNRNIYIKTLVDLTLSIFVDTPSKIQFLFLSSYLLSEKKKMAVSSLNKNVGFRMEKSLHATSFDL